MKFIDQCRVTVAGGKGGDGVIHWRREKYLPNGGPDGGDGGHGGAVIFQASESVNTLIEYRFRPQLEAESGEAGGANNRTGASGKDLVLLVPVGTLVQFQNQEVADLSRPGATWVAARGGRGGKGNTTFKGPAERSPERATSGSPGEFFTFQLTLKSVADVGLLGFPNAGKSTLLSRVSSAKPKIADYPFTTLVPQLGVVRVAENQSFVMADIPGIIEGAAEGRGLGSRFLQHVERTRVLAHLIDISSPQYQSIDERVAAALAERQAIERELENYSDQLLKVTRILVLTKADLSGVREAFERLSWENSHLISAHTGEGLEALTSKLLEHSFATKDAL